MLDWFLAQKDKDSWMIIGRWNIKCKLNDYRPLEYQMQIEKVFLDRYWKITLCLALWRTSAMETTKTITPRILILAWLGWYADSRFRHTAGLIFVLRL